MNENIETIRKRLDHRASTIARVRIAELVASEHGRLDRLSAEAAGVHVDLSRNLLDLDVLDDLLALAEAARVPAAVDALVAGETVNRTEDRPALHTALRSRPGPRDGGKERARAVAGTLDRVEQIADAVRGGAWRGHGGDRIADVVHIGIGGSHLGPELVCEALRYDAKDGPRLHFLANADGGAFERIVGPLDPGTTLFIVASKSFGTAETRLNAESARTWLRSRLPEPEAVARHFVAVSANVDAAGRFGIPAENVLPMWD